ncbi:MAG: phytanoyl-CoA dioxygenase family protein, partial [Alphaproteobacteria bacterium]|nr:phytanoyl-CoA dioxygenase family protein [Alphaproteobacteria bacterium]
AAMPTIDAAPIEPGEDVRSSPLLQTAVKLYLENGCLLIKNAFDADYVRGLRDTFTENYAAYLDDRIYEDANNVGDKRIMVTLKLEGMFADKGFYSPPKLFPILQFLLTAKLIVAGLGCVVAQPGSQEQPCHRDYMNIYDPGFYYPGVETFIANGPPYAISVGLPLTPITKLTGNTRFWPGSHLAMVNRNDPGLGPGVDFEADLGSCYLWDYRLLHCGVANRSDQIRLLVYAVYSRPWFRDAINYPKQRPIDITEDRLFALPDGDERLFSWALVGPSGGLCQCNSGLLYKRCHGKPGAEA